MKPKAYTLIELLVSIGIIAILAAVITPVILGAKRKGKESVTLSNLKQLGAAVQVYRESYDDQLPQRLSHLYPSYTGNESEIFRSPLDPKGGHHPFTGRMEGDSIIPEGVSFTWVPEWDRAKAWGWWEEWPKRGPGKWGGLTPISECHWFWATKFNEFDDKDKMGNARGRAAILTLDGSVVFMPAKAPVEQYNPE